MTDHHFSFQTTYNFSSNFSQGFQNNSELLFHLAHFPPMPRPLFFKNKSKSFPLLEAPPQARVGL